MPDDLDFIALTALVVSALALICTVTQLLAQCFATVDGYRKCQPSVMGPWGRHTRLRWRWMEFRFETLFTVPKIGFNLSSPSPDGSGMAMPPFCSSLELTQWHPSPASHQTGDWTGDLVGWVYILHYLHQHDSSARRQIRVANYNTASPPLQPQETTFLRCPNIEIMRQSWDFVPSDVVRPLAFTSVSVIAVVARRLGLYWKQFEPYNSVFRAEGNHQVLTSTVVRGIGTILQYSRDPIMDTDAAAQALLRRTSPLLLSDDLGFGRVGRGGVFNTEPLHLQIGCLADVVSTLPSLFSKPSDAESALATIKAQSDKTEKDAFVLLNDVVPLLTPFLGISVVERPIIPWPNTSARGLLASITAPRAFKECLCALIIRRGPGHHGLLSRILNAFRSLQKMGLEGRNLWEFVAPSSVAADMDCLPARETKRLWDVFVEMKDELGQSAVVRKGAYTELVAQHLIASLRLDVGFGDVERMRRLFATLPDIAMAVLQSWVDEEVGIGSLLDGNADEGGYEENAEGNNEGIEGVVLRPSQEDVEDTWCCMMLRGMCWMRLHVIVPGALASPLQSEFYESKLPVYLG